jgi:seryl-tRNA(Sec) selenium transferase
VEEGEIMQADKKVIAAIGAALQLFMQAEQQPAVAVEETRMAETPRSAFNPWAMAGRQAAMEVRRFWQMRLFR